MVRWDDVMADDLEARAAGGRARHGTPTSPSQLRRRCFMAAAEGLELGRSGKVIRECLLESGERSAKRKYDVCVIECAHGRGLGW